MKTVKTETSREGGKYKFKHGMWGSPEWGIWRDMKRRCLNPNVKCFNNYGGRGITVCDRWLEFAHFFKDMGHRPSAEHSLDRKDNNKGYNKDNCRWATIEQQSNNTRASRFVTYKGVTLTITQWEKCSPYKHHLLYQRLVNLGWDVERAMTTPPLVRKSPTKKQKRCTK